MSGTPTTRPPARPADPAFEQQLREMNEALLLSAVRQQELVEQVEQANAVVRESEERYRNLFNSMDEGYCIIEMIFDEHEKPVDYRFLEVNPSFEKQSGLHDATGKRMRELHPDLEEYWFETYGKVALTGEPVRFVNEAKSMEGRWFDLYAFRIGGRDSRKVAVLFNDITQRRQAEAANATLAAIIQSSDDAIISNTLDGIITSWNKSAERMYGYTEAEAVGQNISLIIPEERRLEEDDVLACLRRDEKIENFQTDRQTKDGRRLNISLTVSLIKTAAGQIIGASKIARDITEHMRVQDALWESEQRLRFVMDSMPQKIFTTTPDGDLDYFNPQWLEFTGMSVESMKDSGWTLFVHPDDVKQKIQLWKHAFDTGEPFQSEHRFLSADGEYRWHISRALPMRDETGRITMWVGSNTDVHDMKQAEAALLGQAVELSDLHRRKDEFLAMLSHELRSPLAPIANAVQLLGLQQGSESPIQQQARSIIERQLGQLQHLVDDLLEVSRITSGRIQLRRERVVVSRIVEGAVETVRPLIEQRHHELTVSLPPEPIWLNADAARLQQVLANLLINAAKYTNEGGHIWLTVETVEAVGSGQWAVDSKEAKSSSFPSSSLPTAHCPLPTVTIRIRDTGVGISPELLPHIFDLFTQAERSLDRSQGGLGIGLALVQRLTNLHGGTVEANSELGHGSEFIVRLPLLSDEGQLSGTALAAGSSLTTRHSPLATPLRVLVVDDNVDTVLSFSMLLRASGHDVRTAHDGLTAVQEALDYQPDAVLLDIGLPVLNGYEVAKRIRQEPTLKNVVLVALTGYGQETDRQTALQAGFNHHLVKPARLEQLQKILATVSEKVT